VRTTPAVAPGSPLIRCRTGPQYMVISPSSPSRRYGVAVSPNQTGAPNLADHALEGNGRDVVAFVDDHEPISRGQFADVLPARQRLHHRDIDDGPADGQLRHASVPIWPA